MKTYKIPVSFQMYGYIHIDAENLEDAIDIAQNDLDIGLPDVDPCDYVEDSWQVDIESARAWNEQEE